MMSEHETELERLEPNTEVFDPVQGLEMAADDEELYAEVLQIYLEESSQGEQELLDCLEAGDLKQYEILVHALKSNLRVAGAGRAGNAALESELCCKSGDAAGVKELLPELMKETALARKYIRQYLRERGFVDI